jgi:hypothetical protein
MSDTPKSLKQLWALDEAPEHDAAFNITVIARLDRRRFRRALLDLLPMVLAIALSTVWVAPALARVTARPVWWLLLAGVVVGVSAMALETGRDAA